MNKLGAAYDLSPFELSGYLEEQKIRRLEEIEHLLEQEEEEVEMPEGDYTIQVLCMYLYHCVWIYNGLFIRST